VTTPDFIRGSASLSKTQDDQTQDDEKQCDKIPVPKDSPALDFFGFREDAWVQDLYKWIYSQKVTKLDDNPLLDDFLKSTFDLRKDLYNAELPPPYKNMNYSAFIPKFEKLKFTFKEISPGEFEQYFPPFGKPPFAKCPHPCLFFLLESWAKSLIKEAHGLELPNLRVDMQEAQIILAHFIKYIVPEVMQLRMKQCMEKLKMASGVLLTENFTAYLTGWLQKLDDSGFLNNYNPLEKETLAKYMEENSKDHEKEWRSQLNKLKSVTEEQAYFAAIPGLNFRDMKDLACLNQKIEFTDTPVVTDGLSAEVAALLAKERSKISVDVYTNVNCHDGATN